MRPLPLLMLAAAGFSLSGCLAASAVGAAVDVATLPVKAASKGVDLATTSQSEADEKRGREIRETEERLGKLDRRYQKERRDCLEGERTSCDAARRTYEEMQVLRQSLPADPAQ